MPIDRAILVKLVGVGGAAAVAATAHNLHLSEAPGMVGTGLALLGSGAHAWFGHLAVDFVHDVSNRFAGNESARARENRDLHRLIGETIAHILEQSEGEIHESDFVSRWLKDAAKAFRGDAWMNVELSGPEAGLAEVNIPDFFCGDAETIKRTPVLQQPEWVALVGKVFAPTQISERKEALDSAAARLRERFALELWESVKRAWKENDLAWPALVLRMMSELLHQAGDTAKNLHELRNDIAALRDAIVKQAQPAINVAQPSDLFLVKAIGKYEEKLTSQLNRIERRIESGFKAVLGRISELEVTQPNSRAVFGTDAGADFRSLIREKTEGFVGRGYVFTEIEAFIKGQVNGYVVIEGDPGVGKTAILAEYQRRNGSIGFFNVASEGVNRSSQFLESLNAQLSARYGLPLASIPTEAKAYGGFLGRLLAKINVPKTEKLVIAVDALDEVDRSELPIGANVLYLPTYVPERVFFIVSIRSREPDIRLKVQVPIWSIDLVRFAVEGARDAAEYIHRYSGRQGVRNWITTQGLSIEEFVETLAARSENNFMYLRYVLSDIERGLYDDLQLEKLPSGLESYYKEHWERMGMTAKPIPHVKLKLIYVLCEFRRPISRHLLGKCANEDAMTVQTVLEEWGPFLHRYLVRGEVRYALYHASFRDFLHRTEIMEAAEITLWDVHMRIAKLLKQALHEPNR